MNNPYYRFLRFITILLTLQVCLLIIYAPILITYTEPAPPKSGRNPGIKGMVAEYTKSVSDSLDATETPSPLHAKSTINPILSYQRPSPDNVKWPGAEWTKSSPEEHGLDSESLAALVNVIPERVPGLLTLLVIHEGEVILEKEFSSQSLTTQTQIHSITKSFIATLIGIAIDQGYILGVDSLLLDYFPERKINNLTQEKKEVSLENLLKMTSGIQWTENIQSIDELSKSNDWTQFLLDLPMVSPPGEIFNYCTGCSHLLSVILERSTGMSTLDFANRFLFEPLNISRVEWTRDSEGTPVGGRGMLLTPYDLARLGYLYLRNGNWDGYQVVSPGWVEAAVSPQIQVDDKLSYGYQWWVRPSIGGYAAIGADGQMVAVIPEKELVVVFNSLYGESEKLFKLIEEFFYEKVIE